MTVHTPIKEVSLQALRQAIGDGVTGNYSCAHDPHMGLDTWSYQARELDQFARSRGYLSRAHPTATGANLVDLIVVRI